MSIIHILDKVLDDDLRVIAEPLALQRLLAERGDYEIIARNPSQLKDVCGGNEIEWQLISNKPYAGIVKLECTYVKDKPARITRITKKLLLYVINKLARNRGITSNIKTLGDLKPGTVFLATEGCVIGILTGDAVTRNGGLRYKRIAELEETGHHFEQITRKMLDCHSSDSVVVYDETLKMYKVI